MKKKLFAISLLSIASLMVLAGCKKTPDTPAPGPGPGGGTDPDIPVVDPVSNTLDKALEKDYTNCQTYTQEMYKQDPDDLEVAEFDTSILYYKGYAIVYDETLAEMGYPAYYYYHDYNGRNWQWFDGNESSGERDGWLKENASGTDLALENTAFYLPRFISEIDPKKVQAISGAYFITDTAEVARLNKTVFKGCWYNDIQSIAIILDGEGYISKIYGYEEEDNDDEFVVVTVGNIGKVHFEDSKLPAAPNETNTLEFWQYKGWPGPEKRIYPTAVNIQAYDPADRVDVRNMEIEEYFRVEHTLTWPAEDPNFHNVKRDTVSWVSSNEKVAKVDSAKFSEPDIDKLGRTVYVDQNGSFAALDEETGIYYRPDYDSDKDIIDSEGKIYQVRMVQNYHKVIVAVGEGEATINVIASSEKDDKELNVTPKYGVKSNGIKVKVGGVNPIDKTNAVYNFQFIGLDNETGEVFANNLVSGKEDLPATITGNHAKVEDRKYSELFEGVGYLPYLSPGSYMNCEASMKFDFDDQQVSSLDFYYGFWMDNDKNGKAAEEVSIKTSNDGVNWTTTDVTEEVVSHISGKNKKLLHVEFAPATMVEIYTKAPIVGGNYIWKMVIDDLTFSANSSCHNHEEVIPTIPVTSIVINGSNKVRMGDTTTFVGVVKPNNATNKTLTWVSSNEDVATIDTNGVVTPVATGKTSITAKSADGTVVSNAIELTVVGELNLPSQFGGYFADHFYAPTYVAVIDAAAKTMEFHWNDKVANLELSDSDEARSFTFTNDSGDKIVANFENNEGTSFWVSTSGSSKINGTNLAGTVELNKRIAATSVSIKAGSLTPNAEGKYEVKEGDVVICTASVLPANANYGNEDFTWTCSNAHGTFDAEMSRFTAVSEGEVTLTVTSDDIATVTSSITFVVAPKVVATSIAITGAPEGNKMKVGQQVQLGYTLSPAGVNASSISWSTSASAKVSVNAKTGLIEAKATGSAIITVTDSVSGKSDSVTITVEEASGSAVLPAGLDGEYSCNDCVSYITIDGDEMTIESLYEEWSVTLTFTGEYGTPRNGSNPSFRFADATTGAIVDLTIRNNDNVEIYVVNGGSLNIAPFEGDYFEFYL